MHDSPPSTRRRPVIRVFVSSTFTDLKHERDALQRHVFPRLERLCAARQFQFQAIDLRWGVPSEAGLDHRTMRICFEELRRSQEISPRPNFLIVLGDRYGWRPLPERVSELEFGKLVDSATALPASAGGSTPAQVLRDWYRKDENAVPPVHVLRSRKDALGDGQDYTEEKVWRPVEDVLWRIIKEAFPADGLATRFKLDAPADQPLPSIVRFQASATEQEIWRGALGAPDADQHVLAFLREIDNIDDSPDVEQIASFIDVDRTTTPPRIDEGARVAQGDLKRELGRRLGRRALISTRRPVRLVPITGSDGSPLADITTGHLARLCARVHARLEEIIVKQMDEYWGTTGEAIPPARALELEQREYERFAQERGGEDSFVGRQTELQAILDYVGSDSRWPLVIPGASGCGKTALLARASQEVTKTRKRIERFIGVAPRSSDLRSLLSSLCQELRHRNPREDALPTDIKELRDEFSQHLQAATPEQPLILFLDALDQLADADNGRLLNWLPLGSLPAHVKLVVSCLSDRATGDPAGQPYTELKRRQIPVENFINLDVLSTAEARSLLFDRWLPKAGRKVNDDQRARIEQSLASPACRQPIFLKLLFEEVQLWHSYDPPPVPGESVPALLGQLFDRLGQPTNHGPMLVNRVLGYLSASRYGLAENEILEILFADPEYRAKLDEATEQTRHELPPNAKRIPIALWSRLRFDVAPYLTERAAPGANVLTFYHRQVAEWVQEHILKQAEHSWQPHRRLAGYFRTLADPGKNGTWGGASLRGLAEVLYHQERGEQYAELAQTLGSLDYVQARCGQGDVYQMILDFLAGRRALPEGPDRDELASIEEALRHEAPKLARWPDIARSQLYNYLRWNDWAAGILSRVRAGEIPPLRATRPIHDPRAGASPAVIAPESGHISCCDIAADGSIAVFGVRHNAVCHPGDEGWVEVTERPSWKVVARLQPFGPRATGPDLKGPVSCVAIAHGGRLVALGSGEGEVVVVDLNGMLAQRFTSDARMAVTALCWSPGDDRLLIARGSRGQWYMRGTLVCVDLQDGRCVWEAADLYLEQFGLIWPARRPYLVACASCRVQFLDPQTGGALREGLECGGERVEISRDERLLAFTNPTAPQKSGNVRLQVWDLDGQELVSEIPAREGWGIRGFCFAHDRPAIVIGWPDLLLQFWDLFDPVRPRPMGTARGMDTPIRWLPGHAGPFCAGLKSIQAVGPRGDSTELERHGGAVSCIDISPDGSQVASGSWIDRTILIQPTLCPGPAHRQRVLEGFDHTEVNDVRWSPDGARLAVATRSGGFLYDVTPDGPGRRQTLTRQDLERIVWSPCGRFLCAGGFQGWLAILNVAGGAYLDDLGSQTCGLRRERVQAISWAGSGQRLAVGGRDRKISIFDTSGLPQPGCRLTGVVEVKGWVSCIAWLPDEQSLLVGTSVGTLGVWHRGAERWIWEAREAGAVMSCHLLPDREHFACGTRDGMLVVYQLGGGVRARYVADSGVNAVACSTEGRRIAMGCSDGTLMIWNFHHSPTIEASGSRAVLP